MTWVETTVRVIVIVIVRVRAKVRVEEDSILRFDS
jgi:hypothetical protein